MLRHTFAKVSTSDTPDGKGRPNTWRDKSEKVELNVNNTPSLANLNLSFSFSILHVNGTPNQNRSIPLT